MASVPYDKKVCRCCGQVKSLADFYIHYYTTDGRQSSCIACAKQAAKLRYDAKRKKVLIDKLPVDNPLK